MDQRGERDSEGPYWGWWWDQWEPTDEERAHLDADLEAERKRDEQANREWRLKNIARDIERAGQYAGAIERPQQPHAAALAETVDSGLSKQSTRWIDLRRAMIQKGKAWLGSALVLLFVWFIFELLFRFGILHSSGDVEIVPPSFSASDKYEP